MLSNKKILPVLSLFAIGFTLLNWQAFAKENTMKIKLMIEGGETLTATMENNNAAKDFLALLPLTLEMRDFAGTEKAAGSLPKKLDTSGTPSGHKPEAGDLAHYAPWNNLAAFYKADKFAGGLVLLGHIDGDPAALDTSNTITVTIEKISE